MSVLPAGHQGSTTLNINVTSYDQLVDRIELQLGAPLINIEVHKNQVYSFIDQSIEFYSKYAGYTEEYLIFQSSLYDMNSGIQMDVLFSKTPEMWHPDNISISAGYDMDLADTRKVVDVFSVEPGESTGINTLFTLEQAFAQQTYFSYMLGNAGFDLVTWHVLKGWLKDRERILAQKIHFRFDPYTQILRLIPPPNAMSGYIGVVGCYVELPIRTLIKQRWVHQYALALTKIAVARTRGKYGSVILMGGGAPSFSELLSEGLAEKEKLENELYQMAGEAKPIDFFRGFITTSLAISCLAISSLISIILKFLF